jgi:hypothetical protein
VCPSVGMDFVAKRKILSCLELKPGLPARILVTKDTELFLQINTLFMYIIIITISGPAAILRTLAASHRRFRSLVKTLGRTPMDE